MRRLLPLALLFLPFWLFPTAPAKPLLKQTAADKAIDRALEFLHNTQNKSDGSWSAGRGGRHSVGVNSLAVMAFLSAGHLPGEGKYGATIDKGIRWVLSQQQANGVLCTETEGEYEMYHHGMATLMLCEACSMQERDQSKKTRKAVEKAIAVILKAQRIDGIDRGGWRYRVAHVRGADISVTGWQLLALRAAKNLGCDVPARAITDAVAYIKSCQELRRGWPTFGGFRYTPYGIVTPACTGTSVLCLELCAREEHLGTPVVRGATFLVREENLPRWGGMHFFYGIYYGSQATFQLGDHTEGNFYRAYRQRLHQVLLRNQSPTGSWMADTGYEANYGPNYGTALAVLALTVEYRYLPIYQRAEGTEPRTR